jgi:hypothetical protein
MKRTIAVLLSLAVTGAFAQTKAASSTAPAQKKSASSTSTTTKKSASSPASTIRLWQTEDEIHKALGAPAMYYSRRERRLFSRVEYASATSVYGLLEDVYSRQTSGGEVEIKIGYRFDETQSHLHPTLRVEKVSFSFDKDLTLRNALNSIMELQQLCAAGCAVAGVQDFGETTVIVEPRTHLSEMRDAEEGLAKGKREGDWRTGCAVKFRKETSAFETAAVETITLELVSIQFEKKAVDEERARRAKYPPSVRDRYQSSVTELEPWSPALADSKMDQPK